MNDWQLRGHRSASLIVAAHARTYVMVPHNPWLMTTLVPSDIYLSSKGLLSSGNGKRKALAALILAAMEVEGGKNGRKEELRACVLAQALLEGFPPLHRG